MNKRVAVTDNLTILITDKPTGPNYTIVINPDQFDVLIEALKFLRMQRDNPDVLLVEIK